MRRYSDSAGEFLTLDSEQPAGYKQLYRAAKAKLKLRIQVERVFTDAHDEPEEENPTDTTDNIINDSGVETKPEELSEQPQSGFEFPIDNGHLPEPNQTLPEKVSSPRSSYLDTVLEHRPAESPSATRMLDSRSVYPLPPILPANTSTATYSCSIMIDCNLCKASIPNEHYHCSVCEGGDYDLCQECIDAGNLCPAGTHWLIKRSLNDGQLVSSTTEIVGPKFFKPVEEEEKEEPKEEPKEGSKLEPEATPGVESQPKSQEPEVAEIIRDADYRPSEPVIHRALCDMCDCVRILHYVIPAPSPTPYCALLLTFFTSKSSTRDTSALTVPTGTSALAVSVTSSTRIQDTGLCHCSCLFPLGPHSMWSTPVCTVMAVSATRNSMSSTSPAFATSVLSVMTPTSVRPVKPIQTGLTTAPILC